MQQGKRRKDLLVTPKLRPVVLVNVTFRSRLFSNALKIAVYASALAVNTEASLGSRALNEKN